MQLVPRITKAQRYLASQDWNNSCCNTSDINMIPEGWNCWSFLLKIGNINRNNKKLCKNLLLYLRFQAVLHYWQQSVYLLRPSPAVSMVIRKPCTNRRWGQAASHFTVTPWFLCTPILVSDWEFEKWVLHCNDLWLVFITQTKTKTFYTDSFDFFKAASLCTCDCFVIYQPFQCYSLETENFRKILGFEGLKSYFPPPVNNRNSLEGILAVEEKTNHKMELLLM